MVVKVSSNIFLGRVEVDIIHFIASRPELLARMGYSTEYISDHVNYSIGVVRQTLNDLIIMGLAKKAIVDTGMPGRKPYLFTFPHDLIQRLSEKYKAIKDFSAQDHQRVVANLMIHLNDVFFIDEAKAMDYINIKRFSPLIKQNNTLFNKSVTRNGTRSYTLTEKGKMYTENLIAIQQILNESTNLFINS